MALEAIKGQKTVNEIASAFGVHPSQVTQWKKYPSDQLPELFSHGRARVEAADEELHDALYQQIGRLKVEPDWLRKDLICSIEERLRWIGPQNPAIRIGRQSELAD